MILLLTAALASQPFTGESLRWDIHYAGLVAGQAWAIASTSDGQVIIDGYARNASWYAPFYTIEDHVRSTWIPGKGSVRYETQFREGNFLQDQDMRLAPEGFEVWRRQHKDEGWHTWSARYDPVPYVEDPVSALYALRRLEGAGPWSTPVFSGKRTSSLEVRRVGAETIETVAGDLTTDVLELRSSFKGEVEQRGRFLVYLTQDPRRLPVRASIQTNVGMIRADLVSWTGQDGASWGPN